MMFSVREALLNFFFSLSGIARITSVLDVSGIPKVYLFLPLPSNIEKSGIFWWLLGHF